MHIIYYMSGTGSPLRLAPKMLLSRSSVHGIVQALATVFLKGLAGNPADGLPFVSVPCCSLKVVWLDVGLDAVFELLAQVSLLSITAFTRVSLLSIMAFRELAKEKLSRDPGLSMRMTCPVLSWWSESSPKDCRFVTLSFQRMWRSMD